MSTETLVALLALALAIALGLLHAHRIDQIDTRLDKLECIHRVYEDNSAIHKDAELATLCLTER